MRLMRSTVRVGAVVSASLLAAAAVAHPAGDPRPLPAGAVALGATVTREAGIEFVTIPAAAGVAPGQVANRPWQGRAGVPSDGSVNGRGSVEYDYRIGRYEVTTAQWVEFVNAAMDRPAGDSIPGVRVPNIWGAFPVSPVNAGGRRFAYSEEAAMRGVGTITWRMAAVYCNWLHNDKRTDRAAFLTGAYDTSLFSDIGDFSPRMPGAKFFMPSLDEWIKAAYFDPNRTPDGTGQSPQWWAYSNGTDTPLTYGVPGVGMANALFDTPSPFGIPLGAYSNVYSPWGLFDVAGGTTEWTEGFSTSGDSRYRQSRGTYWTSASFGGNPSLYDRIGTTGGQDSSSIFLGSGFRVAAAIPSPAAVGPVLAGFLALAARTHRRRT